MDISRASDSREEGGSYSFFYDLVILDYFPQYQDYIEILTQGCKYQAVRITKYESSQPDTWRNCRNQRKEKSQKQPEEKSGSQRYWNDVLNVLTENNGQPPRMKVK